MNKEVSISNKATSKKKNLVINVDVFRAHLIWYNSILTSAKPSIQSLDGNSNLCDVSWIIQYLQSKMIMLDKIVIYL